MLNKEYARILIVVLMTLITRLVWIHIVDITPKVILSCTILWRRHSRGRGRRRQVCGSFSHTFGYPFILATVYRIFSPDKYFALLLNILFEAGTGVVLYYLGKMVSNWKTGFFAGIICALWPSHVFYSSIVCTEPLYTLLMALLIFVYFKVSVKIKAYCIPAFCIFCSVFMCGGQCDPSMGTLLVAVLE